MAPEPWLADIDVDAALAERMVAGQFPQFRGEPVRPFGLGWDNAAFIVGERVLFRFPRRRIAVALLEREISILPAIAPLLALPISAPRYIGEATPEFPRVFAGYDVIAGTTACRTVLSDEARCALAAPLGRFLSVLHRIDPAPLVARGLRGDEIGRLDHGKRLAIARERIAPLATAGVVDEAERFVAWLAAHPPVAVPDARRVLVHGDLYARHVLVDKLGHVTGIIDWGDMHLGDPALDVAIAHLILPPGAHAAFREAYGGVDDRTWTVARYRAIYHAVLELDYGVRADDAGMRASGSQALRLVRQSID